MQIEEDIFLVFRLGSYPFADGTLLPRGWLWLYMLGLFFKLRWIDTLKDDEQYILYIFYKLVMAVGGLSNATRTPQADSYCILKKQIYNLTTCLHYWI